MNAVATFYNIKKQPVERNAHNSQEKREGKTKEVENNAKK